jgi:hypothetical protein
MSPAEEEKTAGILYLLIKNTILKMFWFKNQDICYLLFVDVAFKINCLFHDIIYEFMLNTNSFSFKQAYRNSNKKH